MLTFHEAYLANQKRKRETTRFSTFSPPDLQPPGEERREHFQTILPHPLEVPEAKREPNDPTKQRNAPKCTKTRFSTVLPPDHKPWGKECRVRFLTTPQHPSTAPEASRKPSDNVHPRKHRQLTGYALRPTRAQQKQPDHRLETRKALMKVLWIVAVVKIRVEE
jgi:hypothetical protein